jgi:hypothetical protein
MRGCRGEETNTVDRMARKHVACMLGLHAYVGEHPPDERLRGPGWQVCRRCGKRRNAGSSGVPPAFMGRGG